MHLICGPRFVLRLLRLFGKLHVSVSLIQVGMLEHGRFVRFIKHGVRIQNLNFRDSNLNSIDQPLRVATARMGRIGSLPGHYRVPDLAVCERYSVDYVNRITVRLDLDSATVLAEIA